MIKTILFGILTLIISSCATKRNEHSEEFIKTQNELTEKLTEISKQTIFNGFGVALTNDNEVLYQNGFGLANVETGEKYTENTIQNIASVSKTFIGIAILKAQDLGKLKLDDPISKYLPYKIENPKFRENSITIRQLITHTSSIHDNEEYLNRAWVLYDTINLENNLKIDIGECKFSAPSTEVSMENFLLNVLTEKGKWYKPNTFSEYKPGQIFEYSNMGATLAALVLEKATGQKFDDFTEKYIIQPLKMESTGWSLRSIDMKKHSRLYIDKKTTYPFYMCVTYPDGSIITSSKDMSKYICELMKGYSGNGTLLNKESYKEFFTQQLKSENFIDRDTSEFGDYNIGITMSFGPTGNFGHFGGDPGLFSVIYFDKEKNTGKYYITNTDADGKESGKYHGQIVNLLDEYSEKLDKLSRAKK
mgnify:CR=1 FL=1